MILLPNDKIKISIQPYFNAYFDHMLEVDVKISGEECVGGLASKRQWGETASRARIFSLITQ